MKKYAIAVTAFAIVSSLTGFTQIGQRTDQALSSVDSTETPKVTTGLSDAPPSGKSNKYLSSWD